MVKRIGKSIIIVVMAFALCLSNMNSSCEVKAVTVTQNQTYQETINGVLYTYENYSSAYNKFEGVVIKKIQTPEGMDSLVLPDTLGGKKVLTLLMCDSDSLVEKTPITSVTLSKNITYRDGNTLESNGLSLTFSNTFSALEEIKVDAENPYLMAQDGVLFDKKGEWMLSYPICKKDTEYVEPNTVKNAAGNYSRRKYLKKLTFSSNKSRTTTSSCSYTNLETVILPNNIKKIGRDNFCFCEKLKKIKWSKNLKTIEASAFEYCYNLEKVKFVNSVKIGEMAFSKTGIKKISIPKGSIVDGEAFFLCEKLEKIVMHKSSRWNGDIFLAGTKLKTFTIPNGTKNIKASAFGFCEELENINIPKSVKKIEANAFSGCSNLKKIEYTGTKKQWNKMNISSKGNICLKYAKTVTKNKTWKSKVKLSKNIKIIDASKKPNGKVYIEWKQNVNADGYVIKLVFGKNVIKKKVARDAYCEYIEGVTKNKSKVYVRYYVKIAGKKYYSKWGSGKTVK